ncbi:MAG: DsbA family protein [Terriglobales bacterium]
MNKRSLFWLVTFVVLAIFGTLALRAQNSAEAANVLRPPKGAKVALVVFEDLECPDCSRAAPLVVEASKTYKIPVVRYDFPLPQHLWAFDAAVLAHYFGSKSPALGVDFREYIFQHQTDITGSNSQDETAQKQRLRAAAEKFAAEHNTSVPFVVDPQGKLSAAVKAQRELGQRIGIQHTPTLYVVNNSRAGQPFIEVVDRAKLFQLIDQMRTTAD